jgi:hypothetical protein
MYIYIYTYIYITRNPGIVDIRVPGVSQGYIPLQSNINIGHVTPNGILPESKAATTATTTEQQRRQRQQQQFTHKQHK